MGTTAHGLWYPEDYLAPADLPDNIEQNTLSIEAALVAQDSLISAAQTAAQQAAPTGTIVMFGSATPPTGWALCNGTPHGSSALQSVIGSANTPDLRNRFIVGAGSGYAQGATGGADSVTLSAAQSGLPAHAHSISVGSGGASHTHSIDPPNTGTSTNGAHSHGGATGSMNRNAAHAHTATIIEGVTTGDSQSYIDTADKQDPTEYVTGAVTISATDTNHEHGIAADANHSHTVDIGAFTSGAATASHGHTASAANNAAASASASHENRPPYYALTYIIKK